MKVLKIIGIGIGAFILLVAVAGGVFYVGWLMPPSQESVCDNAVPLLIEANQKALAELPEALRKEAATKAEEEIRKACMEATETPEFGLMPFVARMKCMKQAKTIDELKACDGLPSSYR